MNLNAQNNRIDSNSLIKDSSGNRISYTQFNELLHTGDWAFDFINATNGGTFVQLRKASQKEKLAMLTFIKNRSLKSDKIGEDAPRFRLIDIKGNRINSKHTKGKLVILNFWFTTCPPCIMELPGLNRLYEKYKDNNDVIFAAITYEKENQVNKFLKKHSISYPIILNDRTTINKFEINGYPTNLIIDKNGKILDFIVGGFPQIDNYFDKVIQSELKI